MIRPTKNSHPDKTVVFLSYRLLEHLRKKRVVPFTTLQAYAKKRIKGGEQLFLPALNMLFLLGLIVFHQKNDSIEFLEPNVPI